MAKTRKIVKFCYVCKMHVVTENSKEAVKRDFYAFGHNDEKVSKLTRNIQNGYGTQSLPNS